MEGIKAYQAVLKSPPALRATSPCFKVRQKIDVKSLILDLQRYKRKVLGVMWSSHPTKIDVRWKTEDVR